MLANLINRFINLYWKLIYHISIRSAYQIDTEFRFNGRCIEFYGDGEIHAGKRSYIGSFSTICSIKPYRVMIGEGCMISHNVRIYNLSAVADQDFSKFPHKQKGGDVIIGNYVWIGANVFINPGVMIADHAVVGANSVVTKNVMAGEIVGGVPAKRIRMKKQFL